MTQACQLTMMTREEQQTVPKRLAEEMEAGRMLTAVNIMRESLLVLNGNDIAGFGALREVKQAVESIQQVEHPSNAATGLNDSRRQYTKPY
jgi:rRNA processing protein Krr1/Pno1